MIEEESVYPESDLVELLMVIANGWAVQYRMDDGSITSQHRTRASPRAPGRRAVTGKRPGGLIRDPQQTERLQAAE